MEQSIRKIRDFEAGDRLDCYFIIKRVDLKTTNSNDRKYLDFIFGDVTGEISGKLWDVPYEQEDFFKAGMLIKARGTVTSYQNALQFKVDKIRTVDTKDNVDPRDFVVAAPLDPDFMFGEIEGVCKGNRQTPT